MSDETPQRHAFCKYIRTNRMSYAQDMIEVEEALANTQTYQNFWCQHTQTDTGPDDGYVEHARCRPGRACYQPLGD